MPGLSDKRCKPCEGGVAPLNSSEIGALSKEVPDWKVTPSPSIEKEFKFKNFKLAMRFVNDVADLAEREGHHPDFQIHYNRVHLKLWTHAIHGLSENDFILASKINQLVQP